MNRRLRAALALTTTMAAGALAACAGPGGSGGDAGVDSLTVWYNSADTPAILNMYKAYEAKTGITLDLVSIPASTFEDSVLTRWATGERPDVLEWDPVETWLAALNAPETLTDLSEEPFVAASGALYERAGRGYDGRVYAAVTTFTQVFGLFYNKQVLADAGLQPAHTAAELAQQCPELAGAGTPTLYEQGGEVWPLAMFAGLSLSAADEGTFVQGVLDGTKTLDQADSPLLTGFQHYQQLLDAGCMNSDITTATNDDALAAVMDGRTGYTFGHSNMVPILVENANGDAAAVDANVGFAVWGGDVKAAVTQPGPLGTFAVPRTSSPEREAAALAFVRFVTGEYYPTYIAESQTFPVIDGAPQPSAPSELMRSIKAQLDETPQYPLFSGRIPGSFAAILPLASQLIVHQVTPQEVVDGVQSQVETASAAAGVGSGR